MSPDRYLDGLRVLLVEDQWIVALHLGDVLRDAGCEILGPAATVQSALLLAQQEPLDIAVLDINLDGDRSFSVAEALQVRHIPFILATGYGEPTLPERWREAPRLQKPFTDAQLMELVGRVASR